MPDEWITTAQTGAGTVSDPIRPDLKGYDVDGYSGHRRASSPRYVVRVYADVTTLEALTSETGVSVLPSSEAATEMNNMADTANDFTAENIGSRFAIS